MAVDTWDEIRTAFHVARAGTVSGAAEALGVHHATVIRHVDALESRLGAKLFQRHARGYTPTEAGLDLLQVATTTEDQFSQLVGRIKGKGSEVSGDMIVTSIPALSDRITPVLVKFMQDHPDLTVRFLTEERLFRLEYGEAHVAIRAGTKPDQPDNIVQPFFKLGVTLYATQDYVDRHGPLTEGDWEGHNFIASDDEATRAVFYQWMQATIPEHLMRYRVSRLGAIRDAVLAGAGIGFMSTWEGARDPNLVRMMEPKEEWAGQVWLVTHVDLHRTAKVQMLLKELKSHADAWNDV